MAILTARTILETFTRAGFTAQWASTGGNCRAIHVHKTPTSGKHVLITHAGEPFTDSDLDTEVTVPLGLGLYTAQDAEHPAISAIIEARSTSAVLDPVARLLN